MDKQKILELASKIILAGVTHNEKEIEDISNELATILRHPDSENGNADGAALPLIKDKMGFLKFTEKEILKMPKKFRPTFRANGCTVHVRKRMRSKRGYTYEARYRCDGYNISVSSKHYDKLKALFIEALKNADTEEKQPPTPIGFEKFAMFYFENFKKRKVTKATYISDLRRLKNHLVPVFGNMPLKSITPVQCQKLIDSYTEKGQGKTAEETYSILNQIFKMAIAHGILTLNPLSVIVREPHERKHGKALSKDEEKALLNYMAGTKYQLLFALVLYTGLRPNEYPTAKIEGKFIVAVNSKRKTRKVEYKKIPITPMLEPYLANVTEFKFPGINYMSAKLKEVLPDHKMYDLRTTFYTRCQECGVADVARMEFVGHSLGALGNAYTDLSDEFLLKEGKKLNY